MTLRLWDHVRRPIWAEFARLEHEMDMMSNSLFEDLPLRGAIASHHTTNDDSFFDDLPVYGKKGEKKGEKKEEDKKEEDKKVKSEGSNPDIFHSYSFHSSSLVDDRGERITSTRHRYEDSSGRLKAKHERHIGDKTLTTIWDRKSKDSEGEHKSICSSGTPEDFEKQWKETSFGKNTEQKKLQ